MIGFARTTFYLNLDLAFFIKFMMLDRHVFQRKGQLFFEHLALACVIVHLDNSQRMLELIDFDIGSSFSNFALLEGRLD